MNDYSSVSKKMTIEGIDPDLYHDFKLSLVIQRLTMRKAVLSFIEAFVISTEKETKKGRGPK